MKRYTMKYTTTWNDDFDFDIAFEKFIDNNDISEDDIFSIILRYEQSDRVCYEVFVE